MAFRFLSIYFFLCFVGCLKIVGSSTDHLHRAEELSRQAKYDEAIDEYRKHMEYRKSLASKPEWENPNFYYLLIGDMQLAQNEPVGALLSYEEAEKSGIHTPLCADRYRAVARWYEEKGQLRKAREILERYKSRDPLLFDAILDRVSREIVAEEDGVR